MEDMENVQLFSAYRMRLSGKGTRFIEPEEIAESIEEAHRKAMEQNRKLPLWGELYPVKGFVRVRLTLGEEVEVPKWEPTKRETTQ